MSNAINETTFNHSHNTTTLCLQANFKQTEAGVIPSDWTAKQLKDVFALKNGYSFKGEFFSNDGPIVLTPGNFKLEGGLYFETRNTKRYCAEYPKGYEFEKGDLVVVMTDLTPDCNLLGKPAFVDFDEKILHNQRIGKITQLLKNWEPRFLYYTLLSPAYLSNVKSAATGSTVRHTSPSTIASTWIAEPPFLEQTSIANALSDVDALIQELEKLIAKKQAIKTATMQQLLTGRTRLPQFAHHPDGRKKGYKPSELGEIPEDWYVQSISELNFDISDGNYSSKYPRSDEFKLTGVPFIRANNIKSLTIDDEDMRFISEEKHKEITKGHLKEGDVLITNRGEIGNLAIVPSRHVGSNINAQIVRINTAGSTVVNSYFAYYLQKEEVKQILMDLQTGSALKQLPVNKLKTLKIIVPQIAEQIALANILSDIDSEVLALEQRLNKTRQIKQGMMQELLTGKTRLVKPAGAA